MRPIICFECGYRGSVNCNQATECTKKWTVVTEKTWHIYMYTYVLYKYMLSTREINELEDKQYRLVSIYLTVY